MIPTRGKDRLPGELSYPLGAADLSEALEGATPLALALWFRARAVHRAADFQATIRARGRIDVLAAAHHATASPPFWDAGVEVTIYAVPRSLRADARRALLDDGLPQVRGWLRDWRTDALDHANCRLTLDLADGTIAYRQRPAR